MSEMLTEGLLILLLLLANGLFAMSEMALVSSRKARLQQYADEGDSKAKSALELANAPEHFLSTVQIGITLIGILAGAFGGATIAEELALVIARVPALTPYSEGIAFALVVMVITFLSLVIGELVPKQVALSQPERIAATVAGPMKVLSRIASPAVHLLSLSSRALIRLLGIKPSSEPAVTEEEVRVLIDQGTLAGTFEEAERDMIDNVLRLADRRVGAFMTPRTEVVWLDLEAPPETIRATILEHAHSRFPVGRRSLDHLLGVVQARDLLVLSLEGRPVDLEAALQQPLFIPESTPALRALELFKQHRTTLALVLDEYGGLEGLVTVNDLLASIVGDVSLSDEPLESGAVQREDGSWLVDAMMSIDEFRARFDLDELPDEETGGYHTLAGFVLSHLERIPTPGDHFTWQGLRFEVVDMDGHRIDKLLVTQVPEEAPEEG